MALERFLEKSGDNYSLAREEQLTDAILMEMRAKTLFVPSAAGVEDSLSVIVSKQINEGRSHRFEWFGGDYSAEDHTPGDEMAGQQYEFDKGTITVDQYIVKHAKVAKEDKNIAHYNPDPSLVKWIAQGIAEELDDRAVRMCVSAARTSALTKNGITIHPGGNAVTNTDGTSLQNYYSDDTTGSGRIDDDVAELAYLLDADGVPDEGRFLVITPWIRRVLRHETNLFNKDYSSDSNDLNSRVIGTWHGFNVLKPYKRMPTDYDLTRPSKYQIDCTWAGTGEPAALAFCGASTGQAAVGYVQAADVRGHMEVNEYDNTIFHKGEVMAGFGVLHPQCAGIIQVQTT